MKLFTRRPRGAHRRPSPWRPDPRRTQRQFALTVVMLNILALPMTLVMLAGLADRTAYAIRDTAAGPSYLAGPVVTDCAEEDGSGSHLPCYWDMTARGNGDATVAFRTTMGVTGLILYPGPLRADGTPVACFETMVAPSPGHRFLCEDGVEW